ncbi:hypothetical protein TSMEX_006870, partial [Taenia solium]
FSVAGLAESDGFARNAKSLGALKRVQLLRDNSQLSSRLRTITQPMHTQSTQSVAKMYNGRV